jgi:RimJ/RimL family protein N-acetyltransferase
MRLISVYDYESFDDACLLLYQLLQEREPHQSISHKMLPGYDGHCMFVESRPYEAWYVIEVDGYPRGAVYLSKQREIGIAILKGQRGRGYGFDAVHQLMRQHPGRFLWNVNPENTASIALAHKLGFSLRPIQHTYERPA